MPANLAKAKNFLYNTDYPLDKVIYLKSNSVTIPSPTAGLVVTIAHGLGLVPLVSGSWSLTPDFSVQYEYGSGTFPSSNIGASNFNQLMTIAADGTNVYITPTNVSGSSFTLYYRIYGLAPFGTNISVLPTASAGDDFSFNTDYNYTKLYLSNNFPAIAGATTNIIHGLGYVPQVSIWVEDSLGKTAPLDISDAPPSFTTYVIASVTSSSLSIVVPSSPAYNKVHYRLYFDNA